MMDGHQPLTRTGTAMAVSPVLVQKAIDEVKDFGDDRIKQEHEALEGVMDRVVEAAGPDFDLSADAVGEIEGYGGKDSSVTDRAARFVEHHSRLSGLQHVMTTRHGAAEAKAEFEQLREQALHARIAEAGTPQAAKMQERLPSDLVFAELLNQFDGITMGDTLIRDVIAKTGDRGFQLETPIDPARYLGATVTTSDGWDPFVTRQPGFTRFISRPLQVIDTLPMASTMQHSIKYMIQVVRTAPSDDDMAVAEGALSTEAAMEWWEYDEPMRELAAHIPVTELQMEDVSQIRAIIDQDLRLMVLQSLDGELLTGPGTSDRILGITGSRTINGTATTPLKRVWTKSSGSRSDQLKDLKRAKTQLKLSGRVMPNVIYMHDNVWDEIALKETQSAGFYLGSPATDFVTRIWSLPVVLTDHLSDQNTNTGTGINAIIADTMYLRHWSRRSIHSEIGRVADQFIRRTWTIRAGLRCCVQVRRPQAVLTMSNA